MQTFRVSSNDHIPYKCLCWTGLTLQNILGNLCRRCGEHRLKSKLQLNSPTLQKSKELVGNVGTTLWGGHGKEGFCSSEYSLNTLGCPVVCLGCLSFGFALPEKAEKFSYCNFSELWKWTIEFSALVNCFFSLELEGIILIYTGDWCLPMWFGCRLAWSFWWDPCRNGQKHARLSSVLNLVTLTNLSIELVCPIWNISRITAIFSMGDEFFKCHALVPSQLHEKLGCIAGRIRHSHG